MHNPQKHGAERQPHRSAQPQECAGQKASSSQAKTAGCVYTVMKCEVFMQRDRSKGASARTTCIQSSSLCSDCTFLSFCSIVLGFVRWCFCFMHFVYQPTRHSAQQFERNGSRTRSGAHVEEKETTRQAYLRSCEHECSQTIRQYFPDFPSLVTSAMPLSAVTLHFH